MNAELGPPISGHVPRFFVNQKLTAMVNRYEIRAPGPDGRPGELLALAQQKRLKIKEEVIFYRDDTKSEVLFSFKSRQAIDMHAQTDVFDAQGNVIGWFRKDFKKSLLRSTWHLHYGAVEVRGQERSNTTAIIRRLVDLPLRYHFDFNDVIADQTVLSVERQRSLRDRYEVNVADPRLDFRVAAAMTVALDAFQGR
ncbi:MAG: hypothetical protein ABH877_05125 [bacterium]